MRIQQIDDISPSIKIVREEKVKVTPEFVLKVCRENWRFLLAITLLMLGSFAFGYAIGYHNAIVFANQWIIDNYQQVVQPLVGNFTNYSVSTGVFS